MSASPDSAPGPAGALTARLGFREAVAVAVSDMVGSGIFFSTGWVALNVPSGPGILAAWLVGGLIAGAGALSYAELAAAMPRAGGEYNYLHRAFGPLPGFLTGWISLTVGFSAPLAISSVAFATFLAGTLPGGFPRVVFLDAGPVHLDTTGAVALLLLGLTAGAHTLVHRLDQRVQPVFAVAKVLAIGGVLLAGMLGGAAGTGAANITAATAQDFGLTAFFAGLVPIMFCYSGWNAATYVASEIRDVQRILPRALMVGVGAVTGVYLAVNFVYLWAAPAAELAGKGDVAEFCLTRLLGPGGAGILGAVIALSIAGSVNTMLFIGPRVLYAMAHDGLFFRMAAHVPPGREVPTVSIVGLAGFAGAMVLLGDLRSLLEYAGFVLVLSSTAAVGAVMWLRWRAPDLPRPYRAPGYPLTPLLFLGFSGYMLYASFVFNLKATAAGLIAVALGVPAYYVFKRRSRVQSGPGAPLNLDSNRDYWND